LMAVSVGGTWLGQKSRDDLAVVHESTGAKLSLASEMRSLALEQSAVMRNIGLHTDIKAMQADEDRARQLGKQFDDTRDKMLRLPLSAQEREIIDSITKTDKELESLSCRRWGCPPASATRRRPRC